MADIKKKYTRGELTVVWQPQICIHSAKCWKGLLPVFDPRRKPWIDMEAAEPERIMEQVEKCPSGALSYILTEITEQEAVPEQEVVIVTKVEALKNGPLLVHGTLAVTDSAGNEHHKEKTTAFCRCGASGNKPFCDGSHRKVGFEG